MHGGVDACKVWGGIIERKDLGWADKGDSLYSLGWTTYLYGLCRCDDFEIGSQRVEYRDHPNRCRSETKGYEGKNDGSVPSAEVVCE